MARSKKTKTTAKARKARRAIVKAAARAAAEIAGLDEPSVSNAPALPERASEQGQPASSALLALGKPPEDLLQAQEWFYKVLVTSGHDTITDETISSKERRRELRSIGASAAALFPDAVRAEAVRIIKQDADRLHARSKQKGGAQLEAVKPAPATTEDVGDGATIQ